MRGRLGHEAAFGLSSKWVNDHPWQPGKNRDGPGFPGLNQEKWSEPGGTGFLSSLKIPVFPGLNHFIWSGPQKSGPDRKFLVWTTLFWFKPLARNVPENSGMNHGSRFKPESVVRTRNSGLNQISFGLKPALTAALRLCTTGSTLETVHTELYATRRHRGDTRSASPLHIAE